MKRWILGLFIAGSVVVPVRSADESITKASHGKLPDGSAVDLYTMSNGTGASIKVSTYGGIITEINVPDRAGKIGDVALGCDTLADYVEGHPYFGAIVGRVGNRIAGGKFTLDGKTYTLATNNGPNHLHGGKRGFDKVVWTAKPISKAGSPSLELTYTSKDGEEGYPGTLEVKVTYTFNAQNEIVCEYWAKTDKSTPINLTQHSYFNLAGHASGDILKHQLQIHADQFTPTDDTLIPTGKLADVKGTPFDFTSPTAIGDRIKQIKADPVGYDLNYVLRSGRGAKGLREVAVVKESTSGRILTVRTTEPGIQFYSGNFLDGKQKGKGGVKYSQYGGFCLEAQHFPDSINKKEFPSVVLKPGDTYRQATSYQFTTAK